MRRTAWAPGRMDWFDRHARMRLREGVGASARFGRGTVARLDAGRRRRSRSGSPLLPGRGLVRSLSDPELPAAFRIRPSMIVDAGSRKWAGQVPGVAMNEQPAILATPATVRPALTPRMLLRPPSGFAASSSAWWPAPPGVGRGPGGAWRGCDFCRPLAPASGARP